MKQILAATALAALTTPALAGPFTLMIWETPEDIALRTDTTEAGQAYWAAYMAFAEEAGAAGIMRGGSPLATDTVVTVAATETDREEGPLVLGGYFQIDGPDLAAAKSWAEKVPAHATGAIVIHPGYPAPGM